MASLYTSQSTVPSIFTDPRPKIKSITKTGAISVKSLLRRNHARHRTMTTPEEHIAHRTVISVEESKGDQALLKSKRKLKSQAKAILSEKVLHETLLILSIVVGVWM